MFPVLLDDQALFIDFEKFIEVVDDMHELALAGQQFPVFHCKVFYAPFLSVVFHFDLHLIK